jgi:agmatinase
MWHAYFGGRSNAEPTCVGYWLRSETKNSAIYCRQIRAAADKHNFRFSLGGEHLVSFPLIEAQKERVNDLRLVVLDAHHDAYSYPLLTHHSLFYYTEHDLHVPTMIVGARYEMHKMAEGVHVFSAASLEACGVAGTLAHIRDFLDGAPFYFSLDVDVLRPEEFPAVSAPVPGGISIGTASQLVRAILELNPVAADVTEYNPLRDNGEMAALRQLRPLMEEYRRWLLTYR